MLRELKRSSSLIFLIVFLNACAPQATVVPMIISSNPPPPTNTFLPTAIISTPTFTPKPTATNTLIPIISSNSINVVEQRVLLNVPHVSDIKWSPDGKTLAMGIKGISFYDTRTWVEIKNIPNDEQIGSLAFSPNGELIASGDWNKIVRIWQISDGSLLLSLGKKNGGTGSVNGLAFSPDGTLVTAAISDVINIWKVSNGVLVRQLVGHKGEVSSIAFSPDGTMLASGSWDTTVRLWNVADGSLIRSLKGPTNGIWRVSFSPDGSTIAAGSWDHLAYIWNVADGKLIQTFAHDGAVLDISYSPDGKLLATASDDKTVGLWNIVDLTFLRTLTGHTARVYLVKFSPDGTKLASGSWDDGTVRIWVLSP